MERQGLGFADWCADRDVPLHVFDWKPEHEAAGLARGAFYLLRPDTYVALVEASGAPEALDRYGSERGIQIGGPLPG
jgi:hypothetical protein